jgi:protein-S-isoprenylcysteine O-methyltransferase Ste14
MNKKLSRKEIEKKAAIETTKLMLAVVGMLTLVVGIFFLFPYIIEYVVDLSVIIMFLFFIWTMIYMKVEQDLIDDNFWRD